MKNKKYIIVINLIITLLLSTNIISCKKNHKKNVISKPLVHDMQITKINEDSIINKYGDTMLIEPAKLPNYDLNYDKRLVIVEFDKLIDDYYIKILFFPELWHYSSVVGSGIFVFTDTKTLKDFTIGASHISIPTNTINFRYKYEFDVDGYQIHSVLDSVIILHYENINIKDGDYISSNNPFMFLDVDFDGIKELLITQYKQGFKERGTYRVYDIDRWVYVKEIKSEPFLDFDDSTIINKKDSSILFCDGGACYAINKKYKPSKNEYERLVLNRIYEYDCEEDGYYVWFIAIMRT